MTIEVAAARALGGLERAAEDVVVGDGDRPEPFGLCVVDQVVDLDRAVVRPRRVHVEVDDDPVLVLERRARRGRPPAGGDVGVDRQHVGRERVEALALRLRDALLGALRAKGVVLDEPRRFGGGELRLELAAGRRRDGGARCARLELDARDAVDGRNEHGRVAQDLGAGRAVERRAHPHAAAQRARHRRPRAERPRPQEDELPVGLRRELAGERPQQRPLRLAPLEHDDLPLRGGREALEVDAGRHELVPPGEALGRRLRRRRARREQRVEPPEQALAARARGRIREPLRREERRDRQGRGVAEREVGEARQARLEAVDDVEVARRERDGEVRADADRHADPAPPRDRHGRAERDELRVAEAARERAPARAEVAGAVRRPEHGDLVTACA